MKTIIKIPKMIGNLISLVSKSHVNLFGLKDKRVRAAIPINKIINLLMNCKNNESFYKVDEKQRSASLTEEGHNEVEKLLLQNKLITSIGSLYDPKNIQILHYVDSGLKANLIYKKDIDYVVENDQIIIIDEFSGRKMPGRRWSEGLNQSI